MAQNRRQVIKNRRKKQSLLRHVDHGNETRITETVNTVDSVNLTDNTPADKAPEKVIKSIFKGMVSKPSASYGPAPLVIPANKAATAAGQIAPEVEAARQKAVGAPPKAESNRLGNLQKNLRSMVKEKLEDSALGQIVGAFKDVRDEIKDMTLSDDQRAEKELSEKIKADKKEALEKAKADKRQWDATERLLKQGEITEEDFKKYTKDLFAAKEMKVGQTGPEGGKSTLEEDIAAMRKALEESLDKAQKSVEGNRQVQQEVQQEAADHAREVERVTENNNEQIVDQLKKINENTAETAKNIAESGDKGGDESLGRRIKDKIFSKIGDKIGKKAPRLGKVLQAGRGLLGMGGAGAAEAAGGAAAVEGAGAAGAGLSGLALPALGVAAAGALGYGAGTLLYNNSETVRNVAGNAMEGIFGHIKTPEEMEQERINSPEYQKMMEAAKARRAAREQAAAVEKVQQPADTTAKIDQAAAADKTPLTIQDIGRQKNIAQKTDTAVQTYGEKLRQAKADEEAQMVAAKNEKTPVTAVVNGGTTAMTPIAPRNQENTLQRLSERLWRGAVV